ncbi:P-II family nitrogen regulator [Methylococcus mesophilus]|uniref:P-II family nitrogen regulator n=1 Tax=Methylococcus mesophilus TaxID=2993564 RepID=UPI00224B4F70|nr:P-II family nitrogen regulator [Methylococcus mesophilus]UZR27262.1 P-II family nitrogen regulator [Methylococcus mesophilus]
MKLVTAIISSQKLDEAREALLEIGATGLTISRIFGDAFERHGSRTDDCLFKLEILAAERLADTIVESIIGILGTEAADDARILVFEPEQAVRIRTLEIGEEAVG